MHKKMLSFLLLIMIAATSVTTVGTAYAKQNGTKSAGDSDCFQAGDTVYFDFSACSANWTQDNAVQYINLTQYTREDNGGSVIISQRDTSKYNPIAVTDTVSNNIIRYTFTAETAGAVSLRFWRGNAEKMWNNSPLLTYENFRDGFNCVKATDLEGNGSIYEYGKSYTGEYDLSFASKNNLYVHGVVGNTDDKQAWQAWKDVKGVKYFFLPSSTDKNSIDIYNTFADEVTVGTVAIPSNSVATISYELNKDYTVSYRSSTYTLRFMRSNAECAVYVNNSETFDGTDLYSYLCRQKSNYASASGAITDSDGNLFNTPIKKIKGRGNTSWDKDKKSFNINYESALSVAGMDKTKKYSICANYQDDTLSRNRILYDLGDKVGLPYSPDSRYADFYINGEYIGSYQLCQKVEVGKNALVTDITGEEYLKEDGTVAADFPFFIKIDGGDDDFRIYTNNNSITVISPEMTSSDKNYNAVKNYITQKFNAMFSALKNNSSNLSELVDMDSFAKIFLINELSKNWDVGVGSFYFVYKQNSEGKWKFYASPPWDYDNSLGNCVGISGDLSRIGVSDYTKPTGIFTLYKGGRGTTDNVASLMYKNSELYDCIAKTWYTSFVPVIERIFKQNGINKGELYSADVYYNLVHDSAEMNYTSGWLINPEPQWIADHSKLTISTFDYSTKTYTENAGTKTYNEKSFEGVYNFCVDWLTSRSAYLSYLFRNYYVDPDTIDIGDSDNDKDQKDPIYDEEHHIGENSLVEFYFDSNGKTSGDKLKEYGDKDGYSATYGKGKLLLSVDGENGRALEWSDAEYSATGDKIVPIMSAGSKNPWGESPFIQLIVDATHFSDMTFTAYLAGSKKAPANWKVQYSLDGKTFKDIDGSDFTITEDKRKILTNYANKIKLPKECEGAEALTIRISATSTVTISGGVYTDAPTGGEIAINNIILEGVSDETPLIGDVNFDGVVNINDALIIQKSLSHLIDLTEAQKKVADFDGSGKINIKDITAIQKNLAGIV